jgi:hypothetical protein
MIGIVGVGKPLPLGRGGVADGGPGDTLGLGLGLGHWPLDGNRFQVYRP